MAIFAKISSSFLRALQVLGTLYMIGVTSYFIVKLSKGSGRPHGHALAVEIISGAAVIYATMMLLLAICLLQKHFFQILTILMDLLFMGAFVAVAILLRSAPYQSCNSNRTTTPNPQWLGNVTGRPSIHCKLIEGLFGCAIGLAVLFFLTLFPALLAMRSTKKETSYHDETPKQRGFSGFRRAQRPDNVALPTRSLVAPVDTRQSVDTAFTRDTEKGSDVGLGREYNRGYTATNGQTGNLSAAVPPVRTVSPLQSEVYNNNATNTTHGNNYQEANTMANTSTQHGLHNDNYHNTNRSTELPTEGAHYKPYSGTGVQTTHAQQSFENIDPNVGGVTGNIYKMQMNRIDTS